MKKNLLFILLLFLFFGLFACSYKKSSDSAAKEAGARESVPHYSSSEGSKTSASDPTGYWGVTPSGEATPAYYEGMPTPDEGWTESYSGKVPDGVPAPMEGEIGTPEPTGEPTEEPTETPAEIPAGQLTASAYFDNDHYDFWLGLITSNQEDKAGLFKGYYEYSRAKQVFESKNRIKVTLEGVPYATVTVDDFTGVTNANGEVYLFPSSARETYTVKIEIPTGDTITKIEKEVTGKELTISKEELDIEMEKASLIQLMFVVDTTGSMGDEILYLKSEIASVINEVLEANANVVVELSLLFYRDEGDTYVTRFYDFTTDVSRQQAYLKEEYASGGGDFPEAVAKALNKANDASWETKATKILVHVADAPDHDYNYQKWYSAVKALAEKGIRIVTVASSGIDKETEYYFRLEALLTNGCYGYLTNDSGIGGDHIEATTEEKMPVEYLNKMLVRLINGFYTGEFAEAVSWRGQE